jgi:hypothetical protein
LYFEMKLATLILTMSVASLSAAQAEDASIRSLQSGPSQTEHQPAGACTPIGLTANGDIVFPWECRETIEKQRGPISVSLPNPSNEPPSHAQSPSPEARTDDAVATTAAAQPTKAEGTSGSAASPELNETATQTKPGLAATRGADLGRSKLGRKGQHAALRSHQGSSGPANVKKKDRVALQPAAAQK